MSVSPSPSTSAAWTELASTKPGATGWMVKLGGDAPSFSNHSTPEHTSGGPHPVLSSPPIPSISPSPSTSAASAPQAPTQKPVRTRLVQEAPPFSYQTNPSSLKLEEKTSRSPSRSTSPTATVTGPWANSSITCLIQTGGDPLSLSYHATVLIEYSAVTTSLSPSPSTS